MVKPQQSNSLIRRLDSTKGAGDKVGRRAGTPIVLIVTSILLVIITAVGYFLGFLQTKEQLAITRRNLELINRPYVALTNHKFFITKGTSVTPGEHILTISFVKENFGDKPARTLITKHYAGFILKTSIEKRRKILELLNRKDIKPSEKEKMLVEYDLFKRDLIEEVSSLLDKNKTINIQELGEYLERLKYKYGPLDYRILGSREKYDLKPHLITPGEKIPLFLTYSEGPGFSEGLNNGTDIFFFSILVEYEGLLEDKYYYWYIGYYDYDLCDPPVKSKFQEQFKFCLYTDDSY